MVYMHERDISILAEHTHVKMARHKAQLYQNKAIHLGWMDMRFSMFENLLSQNISAENHRIELPLHLFNGLFPGQPGKAGTRKVKPVWI